MPKIEIIETYPVELTLGAVFCVVCAFVGVFIGKEWYKSVIEIFKRGKKK